MASPLSWLLRLAALYHLTMLLAGQHHGVNKCSTICKKMTKEIPKNLLTSYELNQESCNKHAIILKTIKNRIFCADPAEEWVQEAMKYLDQKTNAPEDGMFGKIIQEQPRPSRAGPELSPGVVGPWGTRSPATSETPEGGPSAGSSERTEFFNTTAITSATSWPSSSAYQSEPDPSTKGKAPSTKVLPTQAPSTQAPSTQAPSTQAPSTQALPTQAPSTQALPTQAPSTQTLPTQAPSTQTLPTQAPSTQTLPTQALSTQPPTIPHTASVNNTGSEGQYVWTNRQDPTAENSLGPEKLSTSSAHMGLTSPFSSQSDSVSPVSSRITDPRRQAVGLLAFLGLLFGLGVAMFAYQSLQGCPRSMAGDMVEGLRYVPRSCGSNSYVLVPV